MSEIQKDLRLPTGIRTWWELSKSSGSQDDMHLRHNKERCFVCFNVFNESDPSVPIVEYCDYDVASLKIRAFDEINEIRPNRDLLFSILSIVRRNTMWGESKEADFIKSLINLSYYKD